MVLVEYKQDLKYKSKPLPIYMNQMEMKKEYNDNDEYNDIDLNIEVTKKDPGLLLFY